jgi:hypothetical protein
MLCKLQITAGDFFYMYLMWWTSFTFEYSVLLFCLCCVFIFILTCFYIFLSLSLASPCIHSSLACVLLLSLPLLPIQCSYTRNMIFWWPGDAFASDHSSWVLGTAGRQFAWAAPQTQWPGPSLRYQALLLSKISSSGKAESLQTFKASFVWKVSLS